MKKKECYIYTRVSTSMQVDGYSLDAQKRQTSQVCRLSGHGNCR